MYKSSKHDRVGVFDIDLYGVEVGSKIVWADVGARSVRLWQEGSITDTIKSHCKILVLTNFLLNSFLKTQLYYS